MSYSQCGEDLITEFLLTALNEDIRTVKYLDIGCHHPFNLNNTYGLYLAGAHGVAIDANPVQCAQFAAERPRDRVVNACVSEAGAEVLTFYIMNPDTLSTSDMDTRIRYERDGHKCIEEVMVAAVNPRTIVEQYLGNSVPLVTSIDVEGLDFAILKAFGEASLLSPIVISESLEFASEGVGAKNIELISYMLSRDYTLYADTFINSIFVSNQLFQSQFNKL